nr:NTP transferase domain-containing protein [Rathayibacter rathayi]
MVLAAGAGRRAGGPKALRRDAEDVPWVERAVRRLDAAGCGRVLVVLGAEAERARVLVPATATVLVAAAWETGLSASLGAGLVAAEGVAAEGGAALITLVDLPDEPPSVGARLLEQAPPEPGVLARAVFDGRPGHPVLVGSDYWRALIARVRGDSGARDLLLEEGARGIECGDLWSGLDRDGPR